MLGGWPIRPEDAGRRPHRDGPTREGDHPTTSSTVPRSRVLGEGHQLAVRRQGCRCHRGCSPRRGRRNRGQGGAGGPDTVRCPGRRATLRGNAEACPQELRHNVGGRAPGREGPDSGGAWQHGGRRCCQDQCNRLAGEIEQNPGGCARGAEAREAAAAGGARRQARARLGGAGGVGVQGPRHGGVPSADDGQARAPPEAPHLARRGHPRHVEIHLARAQGVVGPLRARQEGPRGGRAL
mmetsp:Transcript_118479/g.369019  ORF Transcript_118479/g.369019 Transcript_118479/m.369019 type:complete len:238 (-) Transcript_118479:185-898(-)